MQNLWWKLKETLRKAMPLIITFAILYGCYNVYRKGYFRHGLVSGTTRLMSKIPIVGSLFRHRGGSYSYSGRRHHRHRHHRRHHRRHR